jgi:DegV family protein with EDD domain
MRDGVHIVFVLDTLEYLQRGGRIGKAQALMGTLLKFKPLLAIKEGEVVPVGRVRSRRKAIEAMLDFHSQQVPERGPGIRLAITQAGVDEEAREVGEALKQCFQTSHLFIATLGPVVGTHVGPGTIGAAVLDARRY